MFSGIWSSSPKHYVYHLSWSYKRFSQLYAFSKSGLKRGQLPLRQAGSKFSKTALHWPLGGRGGGAKGPAGGFRVGLNRVDNPIYHENFNCENCILRPHRAAGAKL